MKTIVSIQEISEFDIKPHNEIDVWRQLVKNEIAIRWTDRNNWVKSSCPCCGNNNAAEAFESFTFQYTECLDCGSLYASTRPNEEELWSWYRDSEPAKFWRYNLLISSETARLEKILYPRANWILDSISEYRPFASRIVDVSHNGRGLIDLLLERNKKITQIIATGITAEIDGVPTSHISIRPSHMEDLANYSKVDVITAIDAFDRSVDLKKLVNSFDSMLAGGGLLFATSTVSSGFEIQALWDKSPSIIPPDKLNLPSIEGLKKLFPKSNWEILELSTPGMFDVDFINRAIEAEPNANWPRVLRMLMKPQDAISRKSLVELLQSLSLTSFARIVVRKKNTNIF